MHIRPPPKALVRSAITRSSQRQFASEVVVKKESKPSGQPATLSIPADRRRAGSPFFHGQKVEVLGKDPRDPDRLMVKVSQSDSPISLPNTFVQL